MDNAATTAVASEVRHVMDNIYENYFGNPSSVHSVGQEAKKIVDDGRRLVSSFVGCEPEEIIFTSGGSESDNLAIRGLINAVISNVSEKSHGISRHKTMARNDKGFKPHIVTSAMEHHAVLHTIQDLEKEGIIEATYIKPDGEGIITPEVVKAEIRENTVLISLIYVNNETGVVTPIREIGLMLEAQNAERLQTTKNRGKSGKIYFHSDAVQAAEFFQIEPEYLKVDLLTFTAHKIHGPKGIGVLYIRKGTPIKSQITGGAQEFRKRAGTENVAGIAGLAKALGLIMKERGEDTLPDLSLERRGKGQDGSLPELITSDDAKRLIGLRDILIQGLVENIPNTILNGSEIRRTPNIVNISFMNAEGEAIILNLDFLGIAVSSGSACTSRSLEPSHVLSSMGIPPEKAHGSIRFSLSRYTKTDDIKRVLEVMPGIIEKLRAMSPFK